MWPKSQCPLKLQSSPDVVSYSPELYGFYGTPIVVHVDIVHIPSTAEAEGGDEGE